jgi:ATP-dependent helicase HrpB
MNSMTTQRISRASATQRAGRAGRLGPGTCYRLWSEAEQAALLPFDPPEIRVADLTPLALELANWGVADPLSLKWLDPPSPGTLAESRSLLQLLGAVDSQGHISALGRRMAGLPLHPRIARILAAAVEKGCARNGCDLAALLEERDIFRSARESDRPSTMCDYLDRLEALNSWRKREGGMYDRILDVRACKQVDRSAERLRRFFDAPEPAADLIEEEVAILLAAGFPDRIGRQREKGSGRYLLANGTGARLGSRSALNDKPFIVAVEVVGGSAAEGTIHSASAISLESIRNLFSGIICTVRRGEWDAAAGRVTATEEEMLGRLVLSERSVIPGRDEAAALIIGVISRDPGLSLLPWTLQCRQFIARASLAGRVAPEWGIPDLSLDSLRASLDKWLAPSLSDVRSRTDLDRVDMLPLLHGLCTWQQLRILDDEIPTHLKVPSGSRLPLDYSSGEPVLAVKLQELFGLGETPSVAAGRVPVLLHLLSPARRPIQVTRDLHSFWNSTYQQVKKELKGRYPRHPWPDDPWNAVPTARTKRR